MKAFCRQVVVGLLLMAVLAGLVGFQHTAALSLQQVAGTITTRTSLTAASITEDCPYQYDLSTGTNGQFLTTAVPASPGTPEDSGGDPPDWSSPQGPLFVVNPYGGVWITPTSKARWVTPWVDASRQNAQGAGNFDATIVLNTAGFSGQVVLYVAADDRVDLFIGTTPIGTHLGYGQYTLFTFNVNPGVWTITARVIDLGGSVTGLLVLGWFCPSRPATTVTVTVPTTVTTTIVRPTTVVSPTTVTVGTTVTTRVTESVNVTTTVTTTRTTEVITTTTATVPTTVTTTAVTTLTTTVAYPTTVTTTTTATTTSVLVDPMLEIKLYVVIGMLGAIIALLLLLYFKCCKKKWFPPPPPGSPPESPQPSQITIKTKSSPRAVEEPIEDEQRKKPKSSPRRPED